MVQSNAPPGEPQSARANTLDTTFPLDEGGKIVKFTLSAVLLEAAELELESAFWHQLLGGSITRTQTHHFLQIDGFPAFVIQLAPGHLPPQWPDGRSQQMHVDLAVDDLEAADHLAVSAGARRLTPESDVAASPATGSRVYASPAGHPFCLRAA